MGYVELHCHSAYSFLDGASLPEELAGARGRAGLRGARAHRPRRRLRVAGVRAGGEGSGCAPITGAEVTLAGGSHLTLLVETARGYANLCRLLTAAHATLGRKERRARCRPRSTRELLAARNDGLVCLSGCARDGLGVRDPNAAAALAARVRAASASTWSCSARTSVATRAGTRTCASWPRRSASDTVVTGDVHATTRAAPRSRTCSSRSATTPRSRLRARAARQPQCVLRTPGRVAERFPPTAMPSPAPPSWRSARVRPQRRSSATATPTSPTGPSPRSGSSPSATTRSRSATRE